MTPILLADELATWEVTLCDGAVVRLAAHSYSEDGPDYVFEAMTEGAPVGIIELARIPKDLVSRVRGG